MINQVLQRLPAVNFHRNRLKSIRLLSRGVLTISNKQPAWYAFMKIITAIKKA